MTRPQPWWEEDPGLFERETTALEEAGIGYQIDREHLRTEGILRVRLRTVVGGRERALWADYPDLFPYLKPEVLTDEDLPRHRHPFSGNLCLVGRAAIGWTSSMTLADLLEGQLEDTIAAAEGSQEQAAQLEEPQGEPFSGYYPVQPGCGLIVDSAWDLSSANGGRFTAALRAYPTADPEVRLVRGAVLEVRDEADNVLACGDERVTALFDSVRVEGVWKRAAEPLREDEPRRFGRQLLGPQQQWRHHARPLGEGLSVVLAASVFPEEVRQFEYDDGWVFFVGFSKAGSSRDKPAVKPSKSYLAPALRAGPEDLAVRVRELQPLRNKSVTVAGIGGIGAPVAVELAKAGLGELVLVDHDQVEPAGSVRWPLGFDYAGAPKTLALGEWVRRNHPLTKVTCDQCKLGRRPSDEHASERADETLHRLLAHTDAVFDGTAEWNVQHALSEYTRAAGLPYVYAHTTHGAWGGLVARLLPGATCCWACLQQRLQDETVRRPAGDPEGAVQATGCADPTFTGAGFDVAAVSMEATRLLVSTLCRDTASAYPRVDWDVAVASFRDADGAPLPTSWDTASLPPTDDCPVCAT